ncbi:MAG: TonB-dependent siderophore receptor [Steroidobacteraceae bacterium]
MPRPQGKAFKNNMGRNACGISLGALAAGFGFALPVTAQTTLGKVTVQDEVNESRDSVQTRRTSVGRGEQDIRDVPQSLSVVTEKLLQDRKIDSLNEALRLTAGVSFSAAENGTQQDTFIRGFSVAQVGDLLIDGMKDPSLYDRDTFNYDRIEVLRGSASTIFGRGSTGGVVNQVNKAPMLADVSEFILTGGGENYRRTTIDFNKRLGETSAVRVNGMYQASENGFETNKKGVAPSFSFGLGTKDEITLGLFYLYVHNIPKAGSPYAVLGYENVEPDNYYGAANDFLRGKATYGMVRHVRNFADGGVLRTQLRSGKFDRSVWYSTYRLANGTIAANFGPGTVITRFGLTPRSDAYRGSYGQSDYSKELTGFGLKHRLLVGVDGARETADRFASSNVGANFNKGTGTIGNPDDGFFVNATPLWAPSNDYVSKNAGAFVQDLLEITPTIRLLGGLRWDRIDGEFHTTVGTGGAATRTTADLKDSLLSHRAAVLYQPTETLSFHASYGTSFNTSGDTYQFTSAGGGTPAQQAASIQRNADTPPEKSRNFEVGAKLDWLDGDLSTRLALFHTEKYNERTTDADFAGDAYLLSGKRHSEGVELEVVGRPMRKAEVYLSYAFIPNSQIDEAGSTAQATVGLPFGLLPRHSGSVWTTYQLTPKFRFGAGLTASAENYSINGTTPTRGARAPGFGVVDALAEYRISPDLYVQLNGTNLTDRTYATELYRGFMVLGQGRLVKATVGFTF